MAAKMKSEKMIENPYILKYLNRLSDLIFLLACFEEKDEDEKRQINRTVFSSQLVVPLSRKWGIAIGSFILALLATIIFLFFFYKPAPLETDPNMQKHMEQMGNMTH